MILVADFQFFHFWTFQESLDLRHLFWWNGRFNFFASQHFKNHELLVMWNCNLSHRDKLAQKSSILQCPLLTCSLWHVETSLIFSMKKLGLFPNVSRGFAICPFFAMFKEGINLANPGNTRYSMATVLFLCFADPWHGSWGDEKIVLGVEVEGYPKQT